MSIESRISTLRGRRAEIDRTLDHEQGRIAPDDRMIKKLKFEKLRLKEELARLDPH